MFSRYFGDRYFAARFWPNLGDEINLVLPNAYSVVIAKARARVVVAPRQITQTPTDKPKVVVPV
jgi:hypothetical protein